MPEMWLWTKYLWQWLEIAKLGRISHQSQHHLSVLPRVCLGHCQHSSVHGFLAFQKHCISLKFCQDKGRSEKIRSFLWLISLGWALLPLCFVFLSTKAARVLAYTKQTRINREPAATKNPNRPRTDPTCPQSLILHLFSQMVIFFSLAAWSKLLL